LALTSFSWLIEHINFFLFDWFIWNYTY